MSRADKSIVVRHVSKTFTLRYHRTLKQMSVAMMRQQELSDSFLAVNDVSFTVDQGESIGLMGLNGSGKSTLLKMVNGVMRPDSGKVLTRGRTAGLSDRRRVHAVRPPADCDVLEPCRAVHAGSRLEPVFGQQLRAERERAGEDPPA